MKRIQTRNHLAAKYKVDPRTINRWLKEFGIDAVRRALTPLEVDLFIQKAGTPAQLNKAFKDLTKDRPG